MKSIKLTRRRDDDQESEISIAPGVTVGGKELLIVAGPCSVESEAQMNEVGSRLAHLPVTAYRGGAFKPRTSPYGFQGLGREGLEILRKMRRTFGRPVITEAMSVEQARQVATYADVIQIGSRNMQNFELLKALGEFDKPILLKRGLAATMEEFLLAAEYIMNSGNSQVILCERGIRSFDTNTRNVLDLGTVFSLKKHTHLPVLVDPSHAAGKRELVAPLARAAIACGADGIMIETHPIPEKSVTDARQSLSLEEAAILVRSLEPIARSIGRILH